MTVTVFLTKEKKQSMHASIHLPPFAHHQATHLAIQPPTAEPPQHHQTRLSGRAAGCQEPLVRSRPYSRCQRQVACDDRSHKGRTAATFQCLTRASSPTTSTSSNTIPVFWLRCISVFRFPRPCVQTSKAWQSIIVSLRPETRRRRQRTPDRLPRTRGQPTLNPHRGPSPTPGVLPVPTCPPAHLPTCAPSLSSDKP